MSRRALVLFACALALAACGADASDADGAGATGPGPDTSAPTPAGAAEAAFISLDALPDEVQAAIADAAAHFGVPEEEVAVAGALDVVWSDGSLGCPEEGVVYTQALVDGYLLTLEVAGERVAYHGADGSDPVRCDRRG